MAQVSIDNRITFQDICTFSGIFLFANFAGFARESWFPRQSIGCLKGLLVGFNASPLGQEFGAIDPDLKCVGAPPDARLLSEVLEMIRPAANVVWKEGCPENNDPGAVDRHIG